MPRYFTVKQANEALPHVNELFQDILKHKEAIEEDRGEVESRSPEMHKFITLKQRINRNITQFYAAIEKLETTGVMIKSIDEGLLDFPAMRFDEEIWLCWLVGEKEIKFWHEKHAGFNSRKPIEVNPSSLV